MKTLRILGIRGLPAAHGGFETFAEHLALFLVEQGWKVIVYCQEEGKGDTVYDTWQGIHRIRIPVSGNGPRSTIVFDGKTIAHASKHNDLCLTLGYNTALFCAVLRVKGIPNIINMDGIEWSRAKWGIAAKTWFYLNERAGCLLGNHLIADHPEIKKHLQTRTSAEKITTIPYGANSISNSDTVHIHNFKLQRYKYLTLIARPEPENSVLEAVNAFSRKPRGQKLVVLGNYYPDTNGYHRAVMEAASDEVLFTGAIYDKGVVESLRHNCTAYIHGHRVGGTNPSLVEAMGAGNAIIAHNNKFNRWVATEAAAYFDDSESLSELFDGLLDNAEALQRMRSASFHRFQDSFTWPAILRQYESLLMKHYVRMN
ncbi:hypothetical protein LMG31506_02167 [Cupriavidus yeoncheonensis]|uniref:Glycosyltransferase family 1 protein n=1 Tax=Cupriavidus yeoncheonensis TaxID=1462994 RepID=A0A916IT32_9BURK|nr:DUF1972 domain-containing protein [Cupriavidus yeoncheonensis]CAG2140122.1 hypothetical protein LMG31506_02167 [Cupriavidus yeoncheonensis]